jgi:hypothetical protein
MKNKEVITSFIIILFLGFIFAQSYVIFGGSSYRTDNLANCLQDSTTIDAKINYTENEIITVLRTLNKMYQEKVIDESSIAPLVNKLNRSITLLNKAKREVFEGDVTNANLYVCLALNLTQETNQEAVLLYQSSMQNALRQKIIIWGMAPIASLITTLLAVGGYKWYIGHERRKILKTIISRKRGEE